MSPRERLEVGVSAAAAACFSATLNYLMDWHSVMGAALWWFAAFMVIAYLVLKSTRGRVVAADRITAVAIAGAAMLALGALVWLLAFVVIKGFPALRPAFFTQDLSQVGPLDRGGGALHAIIGSAEQVGLAAVVVIPVAILSAVYLNEVGGRAATAIRFFVDAMSGLPSIVAGLLVYTVWIVSSKGSFSGIAGAAALAILMLPIVIRTVEEMLRTVPDSLREASLALGAPQWRTVARIVLPTARTGMVTACVLGIARVVGETAPMLLTAFGSPAVNGNPAKGPQSDLPLFVWGLLRQPNRVQIDRAWTGALILVLFVVVLFVLARVLGERRPAAAR